MKRNDMIVMIKNYFEKNNHIKYNIYLNNKNKKELYYIIKKYNIEKKYDFNDMPFDIQIYIFNLASKYKRKERHLYYLNNDICYIYYLNFLKINLEYSKIWYDIDSGFHFTNPCLLDDIIYNDIVRITIGYDENILKKIIDTYNGDILDIIDVFNKIYVYNRDVYNRRRDSNNNKLRKYDISLPKKQQLQDLAYISLRKYILDKLCDFDNLINVIKSKWSYIK